MLLLLALVRTFKSVIVAFVVCTVLVLLTKLPVIGPTVPVLFWGQLLVLGAVAVASGTHAQWHVRRWTYRYGQRYAHAPIDDRWVVRISTVLAEAALVGVCLYWRDAIAAVTVPLGMGRDIVLIAMVRPDLPGAHDIAVGGWIVVGILTSLVFVASLDAEMDLAERTLAENRFRLVLPGDSGYTQEAQNPR